MTNFAEFFSPTDTAFDGFGGVTELYRTTGLATLTLKGVTYVYAAGYSDAGIQIFTLSGDGTLTPSGSITDAASTELRYIYELETIEIGGKAFVVSSSYGGVALMNVNANTGALTFADSHTSNSDGSLRYMESLTTAVVNGTAYIFTADSNSDSITVYRLNSGAGTLVEVDIVADSDDAARELDGVVDLIAIAKGANTYLVAAGNTDDGLSVYRVASNGTLTSVFDVQDDALLELNGVESLATVEIGTNTYIYAVSGADYGISTFRLNWNGTLTSVHNQDFGSSEIYSDTSSTVVEIDGAKFLAVSSEYYDRVMIYSIQDDGSLVKVDQQSDNNALALDGVRNVAFTTIGDKVFLLATGYNDDGLSVFEVGGASNVIEGTANSDRLVGLSGDDVLAGQDGQDELFGGAGADVLAGGEGRDLLRGGADADVLVGGNGLDTADYTGSGAVRINLATGEATGGHARGDVLLSIENVIGSGVGDHLTGDSTDNRLDGMGGDDTMFGGAGNDNLQGRRGNDEMYGGDGADVLATGGGHNSAYGGNGADEIRARGGRDQLYGGADNDVISAGGGSDSIFGGAGNDVIDGEGGTDTITGNTGADTMTGGNGNDVFVFVNGDGADTITDFTDGADRIDLSGHASVGGFGAITSVQIGGNVLVLFDGDDSVILENFNRSDLGAADFIF
ncbi:beta-propeller fold lactonase family protein [Oceanicella sp. SM1341]|uniref:beta-propeller fold lactonase family protein n=1 Tax=Oceanicella sp. SM1341 TaxID=1548889 RepID=UPI000E4F08AF|nr:beta-propeller fold lactonase family protein [Oceanicella sp. SM1341]